MKYDIDYILALENEYNSQPTDIHLVNYMFALWYLALEKGMIEEHHIPSEFLTKRLADIYHTTKNLDDSSDKYLFFVGWMITVCPWLITTELREETGCNMIYKAHLLKPDNNLYKWGASSDDTKLTKPELDVIQQRIDTQDLEGMSSLVKNYFLDFSKPRK